MVVYDVLSLCVAVSVLQCEVVCCSVLQCVAVDVEDRWQWRLFMVSPESRNACECVISHM